MEDRSAQEATIEALPNWVGETLKVSVNILSVNNQGTKLFSNVAEELVALGVLGQQSF